MCYHYPGLPPNLIEQVRPLKRISTPPCGYSGDTEILTRDGWTGFPQLTYMSEVATRSTAGLRSRWQYPEKRSPASPGEGDMVAFSSKSMDLLLAPGCPVLVQPARGVRTCGMHRYAGGQEWHYETAAYFASRPSAQWEVPATSNWSVSRWPGEFLIHLGRKADRRHPAWEQATEWP